MHDYKKHERNSKNMYKRRKNVKRVMAVLLTASLCIPSVAITPNFEVKAAEMDKKIDRSKYIISDDKIYYNLDIDKDTFAVPQKFVEAMMTGQEDEKDTSLIDSWLSFSKDLVMQKVPNSDKRAANYEKSIKKMLGSSQFDVTKKFSEKQKIGKGNSLVTYDTYYSGLMEEASADKMLDKSQEKLKEAFKDAGQRHWSYADEIMSALMVQNLQRIPEIKNIGEQNVLGQIVLSTKGTETDRYADGYMVLYHDFALSSVAANSELEKGAKIGEVNDIQDTPTYSAGVTNNTANTVSAKQSIHRFSTQSVHSTILGSGSYSYEKDANAQESEKFGWFGTGMDVGFNAAQAIESGWIKDEELSETTENDSDVTVNLPPYTTVLLGHNKDGKTQDVQYQCPLSLSYGVTVIYLASGVPDADSIKKTSDITDDEITSETGTLDGLDENEKPSLAATFSRDALKELANRGVKDCEQQSNDKEGIDWSKLNKTSSMKHLLQYRPMCRQDGTFTLTKEDTAAYVKGYIPVEPLASIRTTDDTYELNLQAGECLYTDTIPIQGYNKEGAPYYGFNADNGSWQLVNELGEPFTDTTVASLNQTSAGHEQLVAGELQGEDAQRVYLRYSIADDIYPQNMADVTNKNYLTTNNIETAMIAVNIIPTPFAGSIKLSGACDAIAEDPELNLSQLMKVEVINENDTLENRPVHWMVREEAMGGVQIVDDKISFSQPGTYHVRAYIGNVTSDWVTIQVTSKRELDTLQAVIPSDFAPCKLYYKTTPVRAELSKIFVHTLDQYGQYIETGDGKWKCEDENATIDGSTFTTDTIGTYKVYYEVSGIKSQEIEIQVLEAPYAKTMNIEGEIPQLFHDDVKGGSFDLSQIKVTILDQYGEAMKIDQSALKWQIDDDEKAEINENLLTGIVNGKTKLYATYTTDDKNAEEGYICSNKLPVIVTTLPVLTSMHYNKGAKIGIEGQSYDLKQVPLLAFDQFNKPMTTPPATEIKWSVSKLNQTKGVEISKDQILTLSTGTIEKGKTADVILNAEWTKDSSIVAKDIKLVFEQEPIFSSFTIKQIKPLILRESENANISDFFTAEGADQYGRSFSMPTLTWNSEDDSVLKVEGNVITGTSNNKKTNLYATAAGITSNNKIAIETAKVATINKIEIAGNSGIIKTGQSLNVGDFVPTVYDQYGTVLTNQQLKDYPAIIRWSIQNKNTNAQLDDKTGTVTVGNKTGVITLTATVANSGTNSLMAEKKINISVTSKDGHTFKDVNGSDWFATGVNYMYGRDLMTGENSTIFAPYNDMARAEFAVMMHRMAKLDGSMSIDSLQAKYNNEFKDVRGNKYTNWYLESVAWAVKNKIITGYDNGNLGPCDSLNREQAVTVLYRYAKQYGYTTNIDSDCLNSFEDQSKVNPYAEEAMKWAVTNKIVTGKDNETHLDPLSDISRAEMTLIMQRFLDVTGI